MVGGDKTKPISVPWHLKPAGVDPLQCELKAPPAVALNAPATLVLRTNDSDGKPDLPGEDPIDIKLTQEDGTECPVKVTPDGNGDYLVQFVPTKEGPLDVDVAVSGNPLLDFLEPTIDVTLNAELEPSFDVPLETSKFSSPSLKVQITLQWSWNPVWTDWKTRTCLRKGP